MSEPVKLKKIVETLELANDIFSSYLDKKTGEITSIPGDAYSVSQGEDAIMADVEIHASDVEFAKKVVEDEQRYVALPSQFDIHEWEIMRDFSISREDEDVSQALMNAIHGSGAFRYFKDKIFEFIYEVNLY